MALLSDVAAQKSTISSIRDDVLALRETVIEAERSQQERIDAVNPRHRQSAINLVHYVAVRSRDIRELQANLSQLGLSSLGRMESGVLANIDAVISTLNGLLADQPYPDVSVTELESLELAPGGELLDRNAALLLGAPRQERSARIMVTFPSEAAEQPELVAGMLQAGMDVARLNCAHDGPEEWDRMIANLRTAEREQGQQSLIAMDLGGPKLRTGPIESGAHVLKVKPDRAVNGVVERQGLIWLGVEPDDAAADSPEAVEIPVVDSLWLSEREVGDRIKLIDARGSKRTLEVTRVTPVGILVETEKTVYFEEGLPIHVKGQPESETRIGELDPQAQALFIQVGEKIVLTKDVTPAIPVLGGPHRLGCSLPQVFEDVEVGHRVLFDDGKIAGKVVGASADEIEIEVTRAGVSGVKLKGEKGINLPDTELKISALTEEDIKNLPYVVGNADIVDMSFVRSRQDVADLLEQLEKIGGTKQLDIVLKIETVSGFNALPDMLLEAMRWKDVGVMIARGDLAVEAGFERLAEVQEEILWLCEAAHVPVIWATQVLDTLARTGLPSRAEVTDAAMGDRAECVMLNKGPFILNAIELLSDILGRMDGHVNKKRSLLRKLSAWS